MTPIILLLLVLQRSNGSDDWCNQASQDTIINNELHVIRGCEMVWPKNDKNQTLTLQAFGQNIRLHLVPTTSILSRDFVFLSRGINQTEIISNDYDATCSMQIRDHFKDAIIGSINLCHGMEGVWSQDAVTNFILKPSSHNGPHILIKYQTREDLPLKTKLFHSTLRRGGQNERKGRFLFWPEWTAMKDYLISLFSPQNENETIRRQDAETFENVTLELGLFVDRFLFESLSATFAQNTDRQVVNVVTAMMNAVQILFDDEALGHKVRLVIKRIQVLKEEPENLKGTLDIEQLLSNFCQWQNTENTENGDPLHWDHAILLSGRDLKSLTKDGSLSKKIVGLSPVSGMCNAESSCTVSEARHFESVFVIAHELGHNLGMKHDGRQDLNECDPSAYLMSPTLGNGKNTWSTCSRKYLTQFLKSDQSSCLKSPPTPDKGHLSGEKMQLPGQVFDAHVQCKLRFGAQSRHSPVQTGSDICTDLHCVQDHHTWTSHSALEGTSCGSEKWCRKGLCRSISGPDLKSKIGQWSNWSPYEGDGRVKKSSRECRPRHAQCLGHPEKYLMCNDCQETDLSSTVENICREMSLADPRILPFGDAQNTTHCQVQCFKAGERGGLVPADGRHLPDGTPCGQETDHFCLQGQCKRFTCQSQRFRLSQCQVWTRWKSLDGCQNACILPGTGLTMVKRECLGQDCTGLKHSLKMCSSFDCQNPRSPDNYASDICSNYQNSRLSGRGRQLKTIPNDPDRACKVSCQDISISHRYYVVSSQDGWFPSGTSCPRYEGDRRSFCVSGKCLGFGPDGTPEYALNQQTINEVKHQLNRPRSLRLKKRELFVEPPTRLSVDQSYLQRLVETWPLASNTSSVREIAFDDPVDLHGEAEFQAYSMATTISSTAFLVFITSMQMLQIQW